jgi:hypothetical protein
MSSKSTRPSPSHSATSFAVGTQALGNDGRWWKVTANSAGVQRWIPTNIAPIISKSGKSSLLAYKFGVGDTVRIKSHGRGVSPEDVGKLTTIVELGEYTGFPGYRVDHPALGNSICGFANGMIKEDSFELVNTFKQDIEQVITQSINKKPLKMAKVKSITKRTTQEVRNIETSLINKEEVFKMLALAEATGLPCLLIGEPGVNSN